MSDWAARLPAGRVAMALVRRGLTFWVLARAMLLTVGFALNTTLAMSPFAALMLVCVVGALGVLESRRLNEHRFFANLGLSPLAVAMLVMLPALLGEVVVGIALWR